MNDDTANTSAIELFAPSNRFATASGLHSRVHRHRLLIRKYWWLLFVVPMAVLVPTYFLTRSGHPAFESKGRIWFAGTLNISEGRVYSEELNNFLGTQAELLRSPVVQQRALAKVQGELKAASEAEARQAPNFISDLRNGAIKLVKGLLGSGSSAQGGPVEMPVKLYVTESSKSSMLDLRAVGPEPRVTQDFLNAVMDEFLNFKREVRAKTSDRTAASVTQEISQLAKAVEAQQGLLQAFQSSNNIGFVQEQGNSAANYLAGLQRQLAVLRTEQRLLKMLGPEQFLPLADKPKAVDFDSKIAGEESAEGLLTSLAGPQADLFKANQEKQLLETKRDELLQFLRPTHPKIVKLNEDIARQAKLVQISREERLRQLTNRRQAIDLQIRNLEEAANEWESKAQEASRKIAEHDRLRQELQRLQAAYDKLVGLRQTVDVGKTFEQEQLSVVDAASPPFPVNHLLRNLAIGLAASILIIFGLLYVFSVFDDRFASLSELRGQLSEIIIGQIPEIALRAPKGGLEVDSLEKQRFEFVESFRSIRSSLLFMGNGHPRPKTILIGSSVPQEGKSTVALYLSATVAMGGSKVLLVDGDLRRASLHKQFKLQQAPGLAEILDQNFDADKAIASTRLPNLSLLPAGEARRNPGELVLSKNWETFLQNVSSRFDFIFIDTPPVLATDDASSLATRVDGALFVVRGSFTSARLARSALDILHQRHANVLGVVFNRGTASSYEPYQYGSYKDEYAWRGATTLPAPAVAASTRRAV